MKRIGIFLIIILVQFLIAEQLTVSGPVPTCGFPLVQNKTGDVIIKSRLSKPADGDTTFFIYENITTTSPTLIEVAFVKMLEEGGIVIYAEQAEIDEDHVSASDARRIMDALLYETPTNSIDPDKGIVANEIEIFGNIPDVDQNNQLFILLTDIRDDYDGDDNIYYIAGYFDPQDQETSSGGNFGDIMYIDTNPGKIYDETTLGTVAHELQHLIHYGIDEDERTWLNEGMSEFAMYILGFDFHSSGTFLRDTNRPLTSFDNSLTDYAKVGLWTLYCYGQFGMEFIQDVIKQTTNSLESYDNVLSLHNTGVDISSLMRNWFVANLINDSGVYNGIYSYGDYEISNIYSEYFYGSISSDEDVELNVKNSAAQYIQFYAGKNASFTMDFVKDSDFKLVIVKEGDETTVSFPSLSSSPYQFNDPTFGINYNKLTFIPYWTEVLLDEKEKKFSFNGQVIGGVDETEILYGKSLTYNIRLNNALAAEKFTITGSKTYRLAGTRFYVGGDPDVIIRVMNTLNQVPLLRYEIVPSSNNWTYFYFPETIDISSSNEIYISLGSSDRNQAIGYKETYNGAGRAYLNTGNGYKSLNLYTLTDGSSLEGDWMIGAILHSDIVVDPGLNVFPDVLRFWDNEYSKQFEIQNTGSGSIDWSIISDIPDWMSVSVTEGSNLDTYQKVTVGVDRNTLDPGLYNHLLIVESPTIGKDSVMISVLERNFYTAQTGLFFDNPAFDHNTIKKTVQVVNVSTRNGEYSLHSDSGIVAFYPDRGLVATDDTINVDVMIDSKNIQSTSIPFKFFNGIDTLEYAFSFPDSFSVPDEDLKLFSVIPNPYIASDGGIAQIRFRVVDDARVNLQIYNVRGELIRQLKINNPEPGLHVYAWDGKNRRGQRVSSGVYLITLQQQQKVVKQKMLLLN